MRAHTYPTSNYVSISKKHSKELSQPNEPPNRHVKNLIIMFQIETN